MSLIPFNFDPDAEGTDRYLQEDYDNSVAVNYEDDLVSPFRYVFSLLDAWYIIRFWFVPLRVSFQCLRLPKIPLPSFDGTIHKWPVFRDSFSVLAGQNSDVEVGCCLFYDWGWGQDVV
ncbi:hypothetical protein QTP88_026642 [Uroleucon formosanum]